MTVGPSHAALEGFDLHAGVVVRTGHARSPRAAVPIHAASHGAHRTDADCGTRPAAPGAADRPSRRSRHGRRRVVMILVNSMLRTRCFERVSGFVLPRAGRSLVEGRQQIV